MLEDEKQEIVYKAIQDVNKTYREQQITEKDPILYVNRIRKWLALFYAFEIQESELTRVISNIQKARKKSKKENQAIKENSLEDKEKEDATHLDNNDSDNNNSN